LSDDNSTYILKLTSNKSIKEYFKITKKKDMVEVI